MREPLSTLCSCCESEPLTPFIVCHSNNTFSTPVSYDPREIADIRQLSRQHMPIFRTSQLQSSSLAAPQQPHPKHDSLRAQHKGSLPDPANVVHDIKAGLMGLNASKFSDAILKTPDNQNVYVCRALLAVRSSFFAKLFFSDFAERNEMCVSISVPSKPLKHIIEFAYTGDSTLIRGIASSYCETGTNRSKNNSSHRRSLGSPIERKSHPDTVLSSDGFVPKQLTPTPREIHRTEVTDLVELASAADYCAMAALKKWCFKTLESLIHNNMKTACTALEALGTRAWDQEGDIMSRRRLMQIIINNPDSCLLVPDCKNNPVHVTFNIGDCMGALELSAKSLNELLRLKLTGDVQDKRSRGSLYTEYLFQVIYFWGSNGLLPLKDEQRTDPELETSRPGLWHAVANMSIGKVTKDSDGVADRAKIIRQGQDGPRWSSAKAMLKLLDLTKMRSSFLRDYVEGSGLVPQEDVLVAYRHHATRCEDFLLKNGYVMNSSGNHVKNGNPFGILPM